MPIDAPRPVLSIPADTCRNLSWFFTDIDDTLTTDGLIPSFAYSALWELHDKGLRVVPVTGRPAGWCDHIARMWPVYGVVGENGAFCYVYDRSERKMKRVYALSDAERKNASQKLDKLGCRILSEVPQAAAASDQPYRCADLAIDFCEDVAPLDRADIRRICDIAAEEGATCKVSSIHVNCWYGSFDKVSCVKRLLLDQTGTPFSEWQDRMLFVGDSPNDEPMFRDFKTSIGVANLRRFIGDLTHMPAFITENESSRGFAEAVEIILKKRDSRV